VKDLQADHDLNSAAVLDQHDRSQKHHRVRREHPEAVDPGKKREGQEFDRSHDVLSGS